MFVDVSYKLPVKGAMRPVPRVIPKLSIKIYPPLWLCCWEGNSEMLHPVQQSLTYELLGCVINSGVWLYYKKDKLWRHMAPSNCLKSLYPRLLDLTIVRLSPLPVLLFAFCNGTGSRCEVMCPGAFAGTSLMVSNAELLCTYTWLAQWNNVLEESSKF